MTYLNKMTIKDLKALAQDMGLKAMPSTARKADIVLYVASAIDLAHVEALETNTIMIAEAKSYRKGTEIDGVIHGAGWNCCAERPAKVITFDNGAKWAICKGCASSVPSDRISDLPAASLQDDLAAMDQIRAWWSRHNLNDIRPIRAEDIIGAKTKDHVDALAHEYLISFLRKHTNRVEGYRTQNKTNRLTPRQARRMNKKIRVADKTFSGIVA